MQKNTVKALAMTVSAVMLLGRVLEIGDNLLTLFLRERRKNRSELFDRNLLGSLGRGVDNAKNNFRNFLSTRHARLHRTMREQQNLSEIVDGKRRVAKDFLSVFSNARENFGLEVVSKIIDDLDN